MTYDLCVARVQVQQQHEELCILRTAQRDCADMATEIQALQLCVEEQRRHLQAQSTKPKDPGVGIYSWMDVVSKQHQQRQAELLAAQQASAQQVVYLTEQVASLTAAVEVGKEATAATTNELEQAYRCIVEQRRHIHSVATEGASADPDVGLMQLVRAGAVVLQPTPAPVDDKELATCRQQVAELTREKENLSAELATARDELVVCRLQVDEVTREKEGVSVELASALKDVATCREQVAALQNECATTHTSMQGLACENVTLTAQVCMLNEAVTALQQANVSVEELERAQDGFERLAEANEKLQLDVARLTKERDATVKGIRHWQAEAQKITTDLIAALESRDRFQAEQFTALKQCRTLTARVSELERQVASMHKFYQLGQQVFGLAQVVGQAVISESQIAPEVIAAAMNEKDVKEAKETPNKKNKGKKKKN